MKKTTNNMGKDNSKEIAEHIIMMVRANILAGKETSVDEVSKLIRSNYTLTKSFIQPDDRKDSPHHHTNRLD